MEMEMNAAAAVATYRGILDFLSESSDDYFFLWDFSAGKIYFSENIRRDYALCQNEEAFCTIEDWKGIVYPPDLPELEETLEQLEAGTTLLHNMEYRVVNLAGDVVWISCRGKSHAGENGRPEWMIGRVSERSLEAKMDRLTGAFNMDMLQQELEEVLSLHREGYLLLVGVDNLKSINLKNGREFGDEVLKRVAESLEVAIGGISHIYRVNGDCFAASLPGLTHQEVEEIFARTQQRLEGQCTLSGGSVPFQKYRIPDAGTLYQYAENSLDYAKARGKNALWFFSAEDYEKDLAVLELKEELQQSVQNGFSGFSLVYQPQVYSHSYRLHGAEALLRYHSPRRGNVSPLEFVPILEQSKLICQVGRWVLECALAQCRQWREFMPDFCISVNMSYTQLCDAAIVEYVRKAVRESGLPGNALTIEVTESMQLQDYPYLNEIFRQWKRMGIQISVDDFGTGYSSLGRLQEMDIDEIKIDRCFISNIQNSAYNYRLLSNMLELANTSQIRVCCEGVETAEELAVLEELHPVLLQGFWFARPCDPKAFEDLYFNEAGAAYQQRLSREAQFRGSRYSVEAPAAVDWQDEEIVQAIMEAENDIFYVSDLESYELYYLNPAGCRLFGIRDYRGKKCYKVLQGRDEPCPFCTNPCLKTDGFYIWDQYNEYCNRHFLLKDKMVNYKGKSVRLEVALDITKHEIVSQDVQERLNFAEKVVEYTSILTENSDFHEAVQRVLASMGEFYQADRSYLFEPDPQRRGYWQNTFEWCSQDVEPQSHKLQAVAPEALERWLQLFEKDQSITLFNLEPLQRSSPKEWEVLHSQGISRLIAVPIRLDGSVIGFIGVDNPRYSIHDDSQIRVLSYFLVNRIRQERKEHRFNALLTSDYGNILSDIGVGLWIIRIHEESGRREMLADDTMHRVMGAADTLTPEECYQFWYSRINDGYFDYVNQSVSSMIRSNRVVQLEYTWKHPVFGEVVVRCTGLRTEDENGMICLKGYHRIISNIESPKFLPQVHLQDVFEYNECSGTIFFHTERMLLAGEEQHESGFPRCWVEREIVHPHFWDQFEKAFTNVRRKQELNIPEILLKGKDGTYQWFRLVLRHPGRDQQDLDTVVAVLEPTGAERVMELEAMRTRRFYQALLSEAIAYAEVDLESGQLQSVGGVWDVYEQDYRRSCVHFMDVLTEQLAHYLPAESLQELKKYRTREGWDELFRSGEPAHRFFYRRPVGKELRWVELVIHIFREDLTQNVFALLYLKDVNVEKEREVAQARAASRDSLTGLYNRSAFEETVSAYIRGAEHEPCGMLMLMDIDNFKNINDQKGHLEGDQALKETARILGTTFRQEDVIGRWGGDEFLIFIKGHIQREILERRLQCLLDALRNADGTMLSSSIGVTFVQQDGYDYNRSLKQADIALYRSKKTGKNRYCFYEDLSL